MNNCGRANRNEFAHIRVSEYFTFTKQIFHREAISLARRANFIVKGNTFCLGQKVFPFTKVGAEGARGNLSQPAAEELVSSAAAGAVGAKLIVLGFQVEGRIL